MAPNANALAYLASICGFAIGLSVVCTVGLLGNVKSYEARTIRNIEIKASLDRNVKSEVSVVPLYST